MSVDFLRDERLAELLVQEVTDGLSTNERAELDRLLAAHPDAERDALERTAAALLIAGTEIEPLPPDLRARLEVAARNFEPARQPVKVLPLEAARPKPVAGRSAGLWFALAASVIVALIGWWPRSAQTPVGTAVDRVSQASLDQPTLSERREKLARLPTTITRSWTATNDAQAPGVTGDIVWDSKTQYGYMRFRGLPANDPKKAQYQLWIFDGTRSDKYPIDGGVFDIPAAGGDVIVPILAKLQVRDAAMFAVTLEQPGGVVVSEREHILVLAKVAG